MKLLQGLFGGNEQGQKEVSPMNFPDAGQAITVSDVELIVEKALDRQFKRLEPLFASLSKLTSDTDTVVRIVGDIADGVSENKIVEYLGKTPKVVTQAITRFEKLGEGELRSQIRRDIVVIQKTLGGTYKKAYDKAYDRFAEVTGFYVYDHDKIKMRYKDSKGRWQQTTTYINLIADKGMLPQFASVVNDMKNKL